MLDLSRVLAGPLCTMMLADLGAKVIKIERPISGDDTRGWGPPFDADGQSAYFLSVNRNKLSVSADLTLQDDIEFIRSLIRDADVVVDNFLPGTLARYGLDKAALLLDNARLIWCTISGFGASSTRPGYDFVVQAESGWMSVSGPESGPPMKAGVAFADVITGKDAAVAILAALHGRDRGVASSRSIDISLSHSATAALVNVAQNVLVSGSDAGRWGNAHPNLVPYQLFDAADRPFVIAVGTDGQWKAAARALDLTTLADAPDLDTNAGRLARRRDVVAAITARVAEAKAAHWIARLDEAGVPCGLVRSVREALKDVACAAATGVAPATGGSVRYPPPSRSAHEKLVRAEYWSAFDHVPILASRVV